MKYVAVEIEILLRKDTAFEELGRIGWFVVDEKPEDITEEEWVAAISANLEAMMEFGDSTIEVDC